MQNGLISVWDNLNKKWIIIKLDFSSFDNFFDFKEKQCHIPSTLILKTQLGSVIIFNIYIKFIHNCHYRIVFLSLWTFRSFSLLEVRRSKLWQNFYKILKFKNNLIANSFFFFLLRKILENDKCVFVFVIHVILCLSEHFFFFFLPFIELFSCNILLFWKNVKGMIVRAHCWKSQIVKMSVNTQNWGPKKIHRKEKSIKNDNLYFVFVLINSLSLWLPRLL